MVSAVATPEGCCGMRMSRRSTKERESHGRRGPAPGGCAEARWIHHRFSPAYGRGARPHESNFAKGQSQGGRRRTSSAEKALSCWWKALPLP